MMNAELCPCGSGAAYAACCEPIILGSRLATTPEQLMRSRYSAYVKCQIPWLKESLEESQRADFDEKSVRDWAENSEWLGLHIVRTEKGSEQDSVGFVEFIARFRQGGVTRDHHELGEFRKVNGAWFFYDGKAVKPAPFRHKEPQPGRNDPCSCGSGKKYKKCCGAQS